MVRDISIGSPSLTGVFIGSWQIWYRIEVHAAEAILNSRAHLTPLTRALRRRGQGRCTLACRRVLPMQPPVSPYTLVTQLVTTNDGLVTTH